MEGLAFIEYSSATAGSSFEHVADLVLRQKEPVKHRGSDTRYNVSLRSVPIDYVLKPGPLCFGLAPVLQPFP